MWYIYTEGICTLVKWSEVAQSCPTLCNPMDYSPLGSSVHEILQARVLEWLPFPSPGDLPNPGIEPRSPALQADTLTSEPPGKLYGDTWYMSFCKWHAICSNMDRPRDYYTKWSKSEKDIYHVSLNIWNIKKWYKQTYLQSRNRLINIENKLIVMKGERREG